jgi:hypothetical protein
VSYVSTNPVFVPLAMPMLVITSSAPVPAPLMVGTDVIGTFSNNVIRTTPSGEFRMRELGSTKYMLSCPITVTLRRDYEDDYIASFAEAELSRSGETSKEAVEWLKSSIVTLYDLLKKKAPEQMGPLPSRQLRVLGKYLVEKPDPKA